MNLTIALWLVLAAAIVFLLLFLDRKRAGKDTPKPQADVLPEPPSSEKEPVRVLEGELLPPEPPTAQGTSVPPPQAQLGATPEPAASPDAGTSPASAATTPSTDDNKKTDWKKWKASFAKFFTNSGKAIGITAFFIGAAALVAGILYGIWWLFDTYVLTPYWEWSTWQSIDLFGLEPGFGQWVKWVPVIVLIGAAIYGSIALAAKLWKKRAARKAQLAIAPQEPRKPTEADFALSDFSYIPWPYYNVEQGKTAWFYSWFLGLGHWFGTSQRRGGKLPFLTRVRFANNKEHDIEIVTEFLPAGAESAAVTDTGVFTGANVRTTKKIEESESDIVTGRLKYPLRITACIAEGDAGAAPLSKADSELANIMSKTVKKRFLEWISARIYQIVILMPFKAAYHIDLMILLIGTIEEAAGLHVDNEPDKKPVVGAARYKVLYDQRNGDYALKGPDGEFILDTDGQPKNVFKANLRDDKEFNAVITLRPQSLLAQFLHAGYRIKGVVLSVVNSTPGIEAEQEKRARTLISVGTKNLELMRDVVNAGKADVAVRDMNLTQTIESTQKTTLLNIELVQIGQLLGFTDMDYKVIKDQNLDYEGMRRFVEAAQKAANLVMVGGEGRVMPTLQGIGGGGGTHSLGDIRKEIIAALQASNPTSPKPDQAPSTDTSGEPKNPDSSAPTDGSSPKK